MVRKKIIISTLLAVTVAVAGAVYYLYFEKNNYTSPNHVTQSKGINYDPPTDEEKERSASVKQQIEDREKAIENAQNTPNQGKKIVTPTITYIGQYGSQVEIGAFVTNLYEDGGRCTATFTIGSQVVIKDSSASKNVSTTDCSTLVVPVGNFPTTGIWNVVVTYVSPTATGSSDARTLEIK